MLAAAGSHRRAREVTPPERPAVRRVLACAAVQGRSGRGTCRAACAAEPETHGARRAWNRQWETWAGRATGEPYSNEVGGWLGDGLGA